MCYHFYVEEWHFNLDSKSASHLQSIYVEMLNSGRKRHVPEGPFSLASLSTFKRF